MLEVLFTKGCKIDELFSGAPFSLFFRNYLSGLVSDPIQDEFKYNFARVIDEADSFEL